MGILHPQGTRCSFAVVPGATYWRWPVLLGASSPLPPTCSARQGRDSWVPRSHEPESSTCGTRGTQAPEGQQTTSGPRTAPHLGPERPQTGLCWQQVARTPAMQSGARGRSPAAPVSAPGWSSRPSKCRWGFIWSPRNRAQSHAPPQALSSVPESTFPLNVFLLSNSGSRTQRRKSPDLQSHPALVSTHGPQWDPVTRHICGRRGLQPQSRPPMESGLEQDFLGSGCGVRKSLTVKR